MQQPKDREFQYPGPLSSHVPPPAVRSTARAAAPLAQACACCWSRWN